MENKVGDNVPDASVLVKLLGQLHHINDKLKDFGILLSVADRRGLLYARRGAEPHIQRVHDLAVKHGVAIDGIPLEGMTNDLALYTALRPFQDAYRTGLALADDTAGQAGCEAWTAFLAYYGTLAGMARHQPEIAVALAPVVDFMATGKQPKKGPPAPAAPPPAAPPPAAPPPAAPPHS